MSYFEEHLFAPLQLVGDIPGNLGIIVTIPCFNEEYLIRTLNSLEECDSTTCTVEVIIHVNSSSESSNEVPGQNKKTIEEFHAWNKNRRLKYFLVHSPALPEKHAGVGLARKIAMDEAAFRFSKAGNAKGVIVCLDADCTVDKNYLEEIEKHFQQQPESVGCSIYFEHPITGQEYDSSIYDSIVNYELFLRYYILSLRWCGFPYPYHTIGSSMAVRTDAYMKLGGMNRRKAGEDFYFLHKLFPFGKFTVLNTTRVSPSPRTSDRVPFGTGAAISKQLLTNGEGYSTYSFQSFRDLKKFFSLVTVFYYQNKFSSENIPASISKFLEYESLEEKLKEIKGHTSTEASFTKRFFSYFDGFKTLKFIHYARDNFYPNEAVQTATCELLKAMKYMSIPAGKTALLHLLRSIEKEK